MKLKALVLGEDTRSFLSVIRSLGKQGYHVDVVCYTLNSPTLASRYIQKAYFYNYQAYSQAEWLDHVVELCKKEHYDVLIPCDERAIFPLYENQQRFASTCKLGIPNKDVIEHLFDKEKTKQLAIACDVPVARGELVKLKDIPFNQLQDSFGASFVVKPTLSFKSEQLSKRQKVEIINNEKQLAEYCKYLSADEVFLVEEYFTGVGEGISLFATKGKVQYLFAHTRVNEPRTGGGSSYRKAIAISTDMANACERLCAASHFDGVGMFEFKKNEATNTWILIEVNARFWGSLPLAIHAGIDFPADYANYLIGRYTPRQTANTSYNTGAYARSFSNDLYDAKAEFEFLSRHKGYINAGLALIKRLSSFRRLLSSEAIDSYDSDDKAPFYEELKQLYNDTLGIKLAERKKICQHTEMIRLQALLYRLGNTVTINFVCYGNIMRSPFAAHYLSVLCKETHIDWTIRSYGFHQNENRNSPDECIKTAAKLGIDLSNHQSTWLKQSHIQPHDITFIFDRKNTRIFNESYQGNYLFNLAHFIPEGLGHHHAIEDPYGEGEDSVKYCYLLIAEALKNIFELYRMKSS